MGLHSRTSLLLRLGVAGALAAGAVGGAVALPSLGATGAGSTTPSGAGALRTSYDATVAQARELASGKARTLWLPDGEHVHLRGVSIKGSKVVYDSAAKNALARSGEDLPDQVSPSQEAANRAAAARQRAERVPTTRPVAIDPVRTSRPANRYAMAGGCYSIQDVASGRWLAPGDGFAFTATRQSAAAPVYFKASDLGSYLLYAKQKAVLARSGSSVSWIQQPGPTTVWSVTGPSSGVFTFTNAGARLAGASGAPGRFRLQVTSGCSTFPEASVNVSGLPFAGVTPYQEVRGYIDAHTHGMAFEFLGGDVHCGRPWSPYGAPTALTDCPDHTLTGGKGAIMESFLSGDLDGHDPVGWPTFKDWPAPHSLTHEGTYYKWMERSWRGGQRLLVNLLVENNQLCQLYPLKRNSCDDMDSIRLQAQDMHRLERYIDAQHGGPGRGWYRIVTTPDQARKVINAGKMAVVMGIETSVPFECHSNPLTSLGKTCDAASIDRQLDEVRKLGVSQMELVNKFDNALAGVAGDEGSTGQLVNLANFTETGSFWRMQHCNPQDPEVHDKDQLAQPDNPTVPAQDALFGAVAAIGLKLPLGVSVPSVPLYPPTHHCNALGLTDLGVHTIEGLAKRHMIFDPDHMSVKARVAALDVIDRLRYPGVISSHSWSTPDAYPRIYGEKGFITPYAGDSAGFVAKWKRHLGWANPKTYWGFGFGADINGLGAQGEPRTGAKNPVTYPFKGLGGVTISKQVSGQRVYDINKDGVAQYGLYPDWIEDLRKQAGNAIVQDMARGTEAYLQMWERAYGVKSNSCTNGGRLAPSSFTRLSKGLTTWQVLTKVGQPNRRLGTDFLYCSTGGTVRVRFTQAGRLASAVRL